MAIETKKISDVSSSVKKMIERADKAVNQENYGYAFEILRNILLSEPGLTEARKKLRHAQLANAGHKTNPLRKIIAMGKTAWPIYVKGPSTLRKENYSEALDIGEKAMEADPTFLPTLDFLAQSARQAGLLDEAINAMETAVKFNPKSTDALKQLADLYQEKGQATKSVQILQRLQSLKPNDLDAQAKLKHATALAAMEDAHWEEADSYRDLIRDKEQAETLEQEERVTARDQESRDKLIQNALKKIESEPTAANYRQLADLYRQSDNYDDAIEAYQKVLEVSGGMDPAIDESIFNCIRDKYNHQINELQEKAENEPDKKEEYQQQINDLQKERDDTLLERMEHRVKNYPNEMQYRFELGQLYLNRNSIDKAVNEFQRAQKNPHLANRAKLYMAKCLTLKGMADLAIEQLTEALENRKKMQENTLKEVLYELAIAYEKKEDADNTLKTLKELYNIDVNYKDVGQRLEKYYQQSQE